MVPKPPTTSDLDSTAAASRQNNGGTKHASATSGAKVSKKLSNNNTTTKNGHHANGYIDEDVDDQVTTATNKQENGNGVVANVHDHKEDSNDKDSATDTTVATTTEDDDEKKKKEENESEFVFVHDSGFNVKIVPPGSEPFDIQVTSMELVQEIHHLLMDREDTCHRTCFSLQLDGVTLDNFAELKNIEGLKEGSVIKVVEEPYTVREARIHFRHVRDLLKSLDSADAYNGIDCASLSFLNTIASGDILEKKKGLRPENVAIDCTPPEHILPGCRERPLMPLHPQAKEQKGPAALKVLTSSVWNPPTGQRKLHGDLMYLYVITLEDKRFHITASTRGFYINVSTEDEFNPKPANPKLVCHSLIELLGQISPLFKRNFAIIQKKRQQRHPFERVTTPYQLYAWAAPALEHTIDSIHAEDAFSSKLGYEEHIPGQTRDWNEELQTTRELPRKTLPERLMRERAVFKVHSDFVSAATRGAMAVIDGNVMAINPGEETKMQMFIWNNIFFSLGFDVRDHYKELGGDAAAFVAPNNDLQGVKAYSAIDVEGLYTLGTVVIDYRGYRVTAQSIIPGILEREQEQSVVYGSVDFGKTVVTHDKYLELLGKAGQMLKIVPHKVLNDKNEEVEICSSVECKGIIGNDGRHYILDLLRTFPPDVNFLPLPASEYSSEVRELGFPKQHRHKLFCLRQELIDAFFESRYMMFIKLAAFHLQQLSSQKNKTSASTNATTSSATKAIDSGDINTTASTTTTAETKELTAAETKQEKSDTDEAEKNPDEYKKLVESFTNGDNAKSEIDSTREIVKKAAEAVNSLKETEFDIRFNPDVYSDGVKHPDTDLEKLKKERKLVKDAAEFVLTTQIPSFIHEKRIALHRSITLTEALHNRGINVRYMGIIAKNIANNVQLQYLHTIVVTELISRAAKHLFTNYIQSVEPTSLASSISHFLNCLLSSCQSLPPPNVDDAQIRPMKKKSKKRGRNQSGLNATDSNEWATLSPKSLWAQLKQELDFYYSWDLTTDNIDSTVETYQMQKISLLRSFAVKTGLQILLRDYYFDSKTKPTFAEEDIVNMFPVVKHIQPRASDAFNFYSTGQSKIQQGYLKEGYELISEALNLLNNVYGAMHPEIAQCLRMLARLNYIMGDHAEAMSFQQKAVLMSEKVNGIEHPYTITEYAHLALYCFANSQISVALKLLYRARYLMTVISTEIHPEMAILDSNIGLILHAVGEYDLSLRFLENALKLNIRYHGIRSLKVAVSYHLVARTQSCQGDFRGALQNEKETYAIYKQQLGDEHDKTKESSECLRHLTQQAVVLQKKMNKICKGNTATMIPPIQIQSPSMNSVLEMLNVINGILFLQISSHEVESLKNDLASAEKKKALESTPEKDGEQQDEKEENKDSSVEK